MEFIPYKGALALKSLGFDKPCFSFYQEEYVETKPTMVDDNDEYRLTGWRTCKNSEIPANYTAAPTWSQAFRFFRENYELFHKIDPSVSRDISYSIYSNDEEMYEDSCYWDYDEAELACLIKLIEIVESK